MGNTDELKTVVDSLPSDENRALVSFLTDPATLNDDLRSRIADGSVAAAEVAPLLLRLYGVVYRKENLAVQRGLEAIPKNRFVARFQTWLAQNEHCALDDVLPAIVHSIGDDSFLIVPNPNDEDEDAGSKRITYFPESDVSVNFESDGKQYGLVVRADTIFTVALRQLFEEKPRWMSCRF